jgi:hypothetical protein
MIANHAPGLRFALAEHLDGDYDISIKVPITRPSSDQVAMN